MCDRISWFERPDGTLLFLTTYDIFDTPEGEKMREQLTCSSDWWGHAAVKVFYGYDPHFHIGTSRECTDFRSPDGFPGEIARAIKDGKFREVVAPGLLTESAYRIWSQEYPALSTADAVRREAYAAKYEAYTALWEGYAVWQKADAAWREAYAEFQKALLNDIAAGSPAQKAFWRLFAETQNRAKAWR